MWFRSVVHYLFLLLATVLLGGFLAAALVRMAPGFGVDDKELDPRLSAESIKALRQSRAADTGLLRSYAAYLADAAHGDLGISRTFNRPVTELFRERAPVTLRAVALGIAAAWALGLTIALLGVVFRGWVYEVFSTGVSGLFLCLPSAVVALFFLYLNGPAPAAIALVVFPRIFRYTRNLLEQTYGLQPILTARAKGLHGARILVWHVLPLAAPPLLALMGVSVSMALGAAIPIEVLTDSPGIGQLAWQAAMGRDLPLLVNITVLVTLVTLSANFASDLAAKAFPRQPA